MIRSYKYKLRPNKAFLASCNLTLDCCRDLYNAALSQRIGYFKQGRSIGLAEQSRQLTEVREMPEVHAILRSFQFNALRRLDRAYQAFFRRVKNGSGEAGFPRFKGHERYNSFNTADARAFRLEGDKLTVWRLGSCRVRLSRPVPGRPKTLTIRREFDGWYAVIGCDSVEQTPLPATGVSVGLDLGLESFATLSNGATVDNPRHYRRSEAALASAQQRVSRKIRGSQSRKRARRLVARAYAKISRQREWFQWQLARELVQKYDLIAVENLHIKGLAQSNLAKSVNDAGWTLFINKLFVKAEEAGRAVMKVSARFTSQDCSGCGKRGKKDLVSPLASMPMWHKPLS